MATAETEAPASSESRRQQLLPRAYGRARLPSTLQGHPARSSQRFTSPGAGDGGPTLAERVARHHGRRLDRVSGQCASSNMSFVRNQESFSVCSVVSSPVTAWPFAPCHALIARRVFGPSRPSTGPGSNPFAASSSWIHRRSSESSSAALSAPSAPDHPVMITSAANNATTLISSPSSIDVPKRS